MTTETSPNLRPAGSTPLRIPARPEWLTVTRQLVHRFLASMAAAALLCLAIVAIFTLLGAGYL